jgi:hypothetical protein
MKPIFGLWTTHGDREEWTRKHCQYAEAITDAGGGRWGRLAPKPGAEGMSGSPSVVTETVGGAARRFRQRLMAAFAYSHASPRLGQSCEGFAFFRVWGAPGKHSANTCDFEKSFLGRWFSGHDAPTVSKRKLHSLCHLFEVS